MSFQTQTFLALWSIPSMWVGVMMLGFLANKDYHQFFPTGDLHNTTAGARSSFFRMARWKIHCRLAA